MSEKITCDDFNMLGKRAKMLFDHIDDMCSKFGGNGYEPRDSIVGFKNRLDEYRRSLAAINDDLELLAKAEYHRSRIHTACNQIV